MKFKATEEQIKKAAALAINMSTPLGMGFMHYRPKDYKPEEIDLTFDQFGNKFGKTAGSVCIDYYEGRMVKLYITGLGADIWEIPEGLGPPRPNYQSWAVKYPTYADLLKAAGIEI
jgi:hypothetical protein